MTTDAPDAPPLSVLARLDKSSPPDELPFPPWQEKQFACKKGRTRDSKNWICSGENVGGCADANRAGEKAQKTTKIEAAANQDFGSIGKNVTPLIIHVVLRVYDAP